MRNSVNRVNLCVTIMMSILEQNVYVIWLLRWLQQHPDGVCDNAHLKNVFIWHLLQDGKMYFRWYLLQMEGSASAAAPKGGVGATGVMNAAGEGDVPRARIAICCTINPGAGCEHDVACFARERHRAARQRYLRLHHVTWRVRGGATPLSSATRHASLQMRLCAE